MTADQLFTATVIIWIVVALLATAVLITTPADRNTPKWWNRLMGRPASKRGSD